ncbi:hypothetical protein D9M70_652600 [compost metagenome]
MAVVDGRPGALLLGPRGFLRRADRADQLHSQGLGPLAGEGADAAGGGVEEDGFAALEREYLTQQVLHGQSFEHHRRRLLEADRIR